MTMRRSWKGKAVMRMVMMMIMAIMATAMMTVTLVACASQLLQSG